MIVFCLCRHDSLRKEEAAFTWICKEEVCFGYKKINFPDYCVFDDCRGNCFFSSAPIVVDMNNSYAELTKKPAGTSLKELLPSIQNNIVGLEYSFTRDGFTLLANSARISRARMFFLISSDAIYFSPDLRLLLPYSSKKLRYESAYSIIKYGDVPEYLTMIQDIFAIPVSTFLSLDSQSFIKLLRDKTMEIDNFEYYFKLSYPMDGGNLKATKELFRKQARYFAGKNVAVLVSGGVDSSLTNIMVNEFKKEPYPAYFLYYGESDEEILYVKKAIENTKAELSIVEFSRKEIICAFETAATRLLQPVGEDSPIDGAFLYRNIKDANIILIDSTSADGCYGSRNYFKPLFKKRLPESNFLNALNERVALFLQLNDLRGQHRMGLEDTLMKDRYVRVLHEYVGPFGNLWFDQASILVEKLQQYFRWYYTLLDEKYGKNDPWVKYTLFKLVHYASKQTIAKTYDIRFPESYTIYPFMWLDVLCDQGHYSWNEKTMNGIVKYPLKKLLEEYLEYDFVHRHKVGLNSKLREWIMAPDIKEYFIQLALVHGGVGEALIGKKRCAKLVDRYHKGGMHYFLKSLLMGIVMQQRWCEVNGIRIH